MTAHWLLQALSDADRPDAQLKLLTNHDDLGWTNVLEQGGTFTWEAWTLDPGTNFSQSHGWGAQAAVDVLETQLGIRLDAPGGSTVRIVPPSSGLDRASGSQVTQRGRVFLDWERTPQGVRTELTVPVNVTARVELPKVEGWDYIATGPGTGPSSGICGPAWRGSASVTGPDPAPVAEVNESSSASIRRTRSEPSTLITAATGIAIRAPTRPSTVPPTRAASSTATAGRSTALRMTRGAIR